MTERERALLEAVAESIDDDGARLVYGDFIAEAGDTARAELINLQIQRAERRGEPGELERRLIAEHAPRWLAPIVNRLRPQSWQFERGFLERCEICNAGPAGELLWSTVRDVQLIGNDDPSATLVHPVMRNLRSVKPALLKYGLATILASSAPIEELHINGEDGPHVWIETTVLPRLRSIRFSNMKPRAAARLWKAKLDRPGMTLQFTAQPRQLLQWWAAVIAARRPQHALVRISTQHLETHVDANARCMIATTIGPVGFGVHELWAAIGSVGQARPQIYDRLIVRAPAGAVETVSIGTGDRVDPLFPEIVRAAAAIGLAVVLEPRP